MVSKDLVNELASDSTRGDCEDCEECSVCVVIVVTDAVTAAWPVCIGSLVPCSFVSETGAEAEAGAVGSGIGNGSVGRAVAVAGPNSATK